MLKLGVFKALKMENTFDVVDRDYTSFMKKYSFLLMPVIAVLVLFSCAKENPTAEETISVDETYFNSLQKEDRVKVLVSEMLSHYARTNKKFREQLFSALITNDKKTIEFLWVKGAKQKLFSGQSLEALALSYYRINPQKHDLILSIGEVLPNLVIKIPEWVEAVLAEKDLNNEFGVYPCIANQNRDVLYFPLDKDKVLRRTTVPKVTLSDLLPVQVKESERFIPVIEGTSKTIWGNDFYDDNFPTIKSCAEFEMANYTEVTYKQIRFVDRLRLNDDLREVKLCSGGGNWTSRGSFKSSTV